MTNQLWPYTPRKRTLGQYDYSHTVDQCIFEPSKVSLPLTDLCCITGSLPSPKKPPPHSRPRFNIDSDGYSECYLSHCGLV